MKVILMVFTKNVLFEANGSFEARNRHIGIREHRNKKLLSNLADFGRPRGGRFE